MKNILEKFSEEEYEQMRNVKECLNYNWHDLIFKSIKEFNFGLDTNTQKKLVNKQKEIKILNNVDIEFKDIIMRLIDLHITTFDYNVNIENKDKEDTLDEKARNAGFVDIIAYVEYRNRFKRGLNELVSNIEKLI